MDYQRLLLDHLDLIEQIVRTTGRRRHLSAVEQDDFAGFVRLRLVEDDYAVLRKFRGRSSLWTYLSAVVERLSLDFCSERWGRWRPSSMASRIGPVAVALEKLVNRDGHTIEEAMEIARTNLGVSLSFKELRGMWDRLPIRSKATAVGEEAAADVPAPEASDAGVEHAAHQHDTDSLARALTAAFDGLPAQDRLMIALRFDHDLSATEIARAMNSSVPTVHRRIERSLKHLRSELSAAGFDPRRVSALIGHSTVTLQPLLRTAVESFPGLVRLSKRDG